MAYSVADPGCVANPAMAPPSELAMEFGPLRDRKSNGSIVILLESKDFWPPYRCRLQIWPPYGKIPYKTRKRSMTKKKKSSEIQKFWEIDVEFFGNAEIFFGKCLKKVVKNFRQKFGHPVSEGLDPLVVLCRDRF